MLRGSADNAAVQMCLGEPNCAATAPSSQLATAFSNKPSFAAADQCGHLHLLKSFSMVISVHCLRCHAVVELASVCDGGGEGQAMKRQVDSRALYGQLPAAADHADFESRICAQCHERGRLAATPRNEREVFILRFQGRPLDFHLNFLYR